MHIDIDLFLKILDIDSTSGQERALADYLAELLGGDGCQVSFMPAPVDRTQPVNVMFAWGKPEITFCTHLDTVPPYIPPTLVDEDGEVVIRGRGACDAKGQIIAMYTACRALAERGERNFGLLLLHGEETGSFGAKEFRNLPGGKYVIVGEPTDGLMVSASKGTKAFEVTVTGRAFHSGYPQYGESAVETFVDIVNRIRKADFPVDPVLGATTYNIGRLVSDNPQNILSEKLTCRIYFRTTFASDVSVCEFMNSLANPQIDIKALGGDTPTHFLTVPGIKATTVAFGSDAPQLTNYEYKALCGPGSILVAHRQDEYIRVSDLEKAADQYVAIYTYLLNHVSNS